MENTVQDERNTGSGPSSGSGSILVYLLIMMAIIVVAVGAYYAYTVHQQRNSAMTDEESAAERQGLSRKAIEARDRVQSGDYEGASDIMWELVQDETADPEQRARAVWNGAGSNYKVTGEIEDALASIKELKKIAVDEQVSPRMRAQMISNMAGMYYGSTGRHPLVFEEMFAGEPFSQYRVPGEAYLSIQNLLKLAHQTYPTSNTAIKLAQWYVVEPFQDDTLSEADITSYIVEARRYLDEAATLAEEHMASGELSEDSRRYASNLYWSNFINTGIAYLEDAPNKLEYRQNHEEVIAFLKASPNNEVKQYLPYVHWHYANWLVKFENDTEAAHTQLRHVVEFMQSDPKPEVTEFAKFIENTPTGGEYAKDNNFFTSMILDMMALDEAFRTYVATVNPDLLHEL